jgi:ketosteroid isomerase-like protein
MKFDEMMMNKVLKMAAMLLLAALTTNANAGKVDKIANKNVANWNYALKSGHVDAIMRFYAQNAMLVQSNGNIHGDTDNIRAFWKKIVATPGAYEFNLTEAHRDGDSIVLTAKLASVASKRVSSNHALKSIYNGTIQHVLKDQGNGEWKTIVTQWN